MIDHPITWIAAGSPMGCWAAAAAMMLGNRCPAIRSVRLGSTGGMVASRENMTAYATELNLRLLLGATLSHDGLRGLLQRGPVMLCGNMVNGEGHCIVVGGMNGDQIRIYDPKPVSGGGKWVSYGALMTIFPLSTRYVLHR